MGGSPESYAELIRHPGNSALCTALELSVLATGLGHPLHLHAEGLRGTGKTTLVRAAARLLPTIVRIADCPYNCEPAAPHCPLHRGLEPAEVAALGTEAIPTPFLEVSPSAKIGTVVGSIDLARLTDPGRPRAALLPGTLARAHRGVVFVDEVNRLADTSPELADALLDVMGTKPGRLQIEETGLPPVVLTCRVTVWAASNPDEEPGPLADIRRQLSDRFDLAVAMRRPLEPATVLDILDRDDFGRAEAEARPTRGPDATARMRQELAARATRPVPVLPARLRDLLAQAYCDFQVESLRAVQAWQTATRLAALRAGRPEAAVEDCARTAPLVLRHRLEPEELARLLAQLEHGDAALGSLAAATPVSDAAVAAPAAERSLAAQHAPEPMAGPAPPRRADPARPRRAWWRPWVRADPTASPAPGRAGRAGGGSGSAADGRPVGGIAARPRLADPAALPPMAPREPARLFAELAPPQWCTPAGPGPGPLHAGEGERR